MAKPLGLNVPERVKNSGSKYDIRPKKLEQWLAALPMVNVGETARLVFGALVDINRDAISTQERVRFLETLRETVHYIAEALTRHFVGTPLPLPPKNQKIAALTRELYGEMATGYKVAIEDLLARPSLFTDQKLLTLLIHRAIGYLSRVLLTAYQVYGPFPAGIWQELHTLYQFAEAKKLQLHPVPDNQHKLVPKSTIATEYKRILLLSLASPYRLRQGEVGKVHTMLERWAPNARINTVEKQDNLSGRFVVVMNADNPPTYVPLSNQNHYPDVCRTLATDDLARVVREQIMNTADVAVRTLTGLDTQASSLSHDLMRRLMLSWGVMPKRGFSRVDKTDKVLVSLGLRATHHFLNLSKKIAGGTPARAAAPLNSGEFAAPAHYESVPVRDINEPQPDVWELIYPHDVTGLELAPTEDPPASVGPSPSVERYHAQIWKMVNESAGGCCLISHGDKLVNVQVGELIGMRRSEEHDTKRWSVGVIRWMRSSESGTLTLGIQLLTPDAAAVGMRPTGNSRDPLQRALLLPDLPAISQPTTLLTPPVPYRVGNKIQLHVAGKDMKIELTKMMENSGLFAQFQFNLLDKPEEDRKSADTWLTDRAFSKVWSSI